MNDRNEPLKAIPIFYSDLTDEEIEDFDVRYKEGYGLVRYLYGMAETEEEQNRMRTYIVRDTKTDEVAGYFSLKAGMISINETKIDDSIRFDTLPGVELANFALNSNYISRHKSMKGCGLIVFHRLILPIVRKVSENIGVKLIYIYALPKEKLLHRYEQYQFKRLKPEQEQALHSRIKPDYDRDCIFMYQEL